MEFPFIYFVEIFLTKIINQLGRANFSMVYSKIINFRNIFLSFSITLLFLEKENI